LNLNKIPGFAKPSNKLVLTTIISEILI